MASFIWGKGRRNQLSLPENLGDYIVEITSSLTLTRMA